MTKQLERELDQALERGTPARNEEIESLVQTASRFADQTPALPDAPSGSRALFIQAVGTRRSAGWLPFLGSATATAAVLVVVLLLGRTAIPGEALYPVRQALRSVGLAPASVEEIDDLLAEAQVQLANAEEINDFSQQKARRLALNAARLLGGAEQLLEEIEDEGQTESRYAAVASLLEKARGILLEDDVLTDENAARRDDEDDVFQSGEEDELERDAGQDAEDTEEGRGGNEGPGGDQEPTNEDNETDGARENTGENQAGSGNQGDGDEVETRDNNNQGEGRNDDNRSGNEGNDKEG